MSITPSTMTPVSATLKRRPTRRGWIPWPGLASTYEDDVFDELAVRVSEAVGLNITGLDILPCEDREPIVLEANCYPGYKALMETTKIPIYKLIVDYFERLLRK